MTVAASPRVQWRTIGRALAFSCVVVLAMVLGRAAIVGITVVIAWPPVFLTVGWIVFALGIVLAVRLLSAQRRRVGVATPIVPTLVRGFVLLWPGPTSTPTAPPGTEGGEPTDRIATGLPRTRRHRPGTTHPGDLPARRPRCRGHVRRHPYLRRLAAAGWNTYLYDQLGAGRSSRLSNPDHYTIARAVADLDAFRQSIGAPRIDLLGYSWGSTMSVIDVSSHGTDELTVNSTTLSSGPAASIARR